MRPSKCELENLGQHILGEYDICVIIDLLISISDSIELINPTFHSILKEDLKQVEVVVEE